MSNAESKRLAGKVAVVTGSGRGIGRAEAMLIAQQGAKVVISDMGFDDGRGRADAVVAEIRAAGGEAAPCTENISTFKGAKALIDTAIKSFGRIDILVNNAGLRASNTVDKFSEEQYDLVMDSHLKGTFACIKYATPFFVEQRSGAIVNTGSIAGLGTPFNSVYAAAKEGIAGLSRSVARELGRFDIRCNLVRPRSNAPKDPVFQADFDKSKPTMMAMFPFNVGRLGTLGFNPNETPENVAPMVVWLCTDAAKNINGRDFQVMADWVGMWSEPDLFRTIFHTQGWTLDELDVRVPRSLASGLKNEFLFEEMPAELRNFKG